MGSINVVWYARGAIGSLQASLFLSESYRVLVRLLRELRAEGCQRGKWVVMVSEKPPDAAIVVQCGFLQGEVEIPNAHWGEI